MDRLSELTDDLLIKILSFIPTQDAVATSVLAKRWMSLWTMVPRLTFDDLNVVSWTLLFHKSPVLESFHLRATSVECNASDIYTWVRIAVDRLVRDLSICFEAGIHCRIRLPSSLFRCETLQTLELMKVIFLEVPTHRFSLPSLRTMTLMSVKYADEESFVRLISCSPVLERLEVWSCRDDNVVTFTVNVPSLQSLVVLNITQHRFVIHSHSLANLGIHDERGDIIVIGKMSNLVGASLNMSETQGNALESLTRVKRLSLSLTGVFEFPICTIFSHLVDLKLIFFAGSYEYWSNLLLHVLHHSPALGFLKLVSKDHDPPQNIGIIWSKNKVSWIQPSCVGLFHLQTFEWIGYAGTEQEKEVAIYILKNAKRLVTATINSDYEFSCRDPVEPAHKLRVFEELEFATRGLRACELTMAETEN